MDSETRRVIRNMWRVRRFPTNTCPASRHAAQIAATMARSKDPDSADKAASIAASVAALWKLRTKVQREGGK
jgi:hypothetical protein